MWKSGVFRDASKAKVFAMRVNEPGDTNPFPQYFVITRGRGFAKLGRDTLTVKENEAYFVATGSDHVFWTESTEPMEMLFLAWGGGA